jgi:hypothetical protein
MSAISQATQYIDQTADWNTEELELEFDSQQWHCFSRLLYVQRGFVTLQASIQPGILRRE